MRESSRVVHNLGGGGGSPHVPGRVGGRGRRRESGGRGGQRRRLAPAADPARHPRHQPDRHGRRGLQSPRPPLRLLLRLG